MKHTYSFISDTGHSGKCIAFKDIKSVDYSLNILGIKFKDGEDFTRGFENTESTKLVYQDIINQWNNYLDYMVGM